MNKSERYIWLMFIYNVISMLGVSYISIFVRNLYNDANNMATTPYYVCNFQIFDNIDSFPKNVLSALDSKKGRLHLWRTA